MLISKDIKIHMAHKLTDYDGACNNIHGHTYKITVGVEGDNVNNGMVVDFSVLKKVMKVKLILIFAGIVGLGIIFTGYLFNIVIK